jgi:hypothetical protein
MMHLTLVATLYVHSYVGIHVGPVVAWAACSLVFLRSLWPANIWPLISSKMLGTRAWSKNRTTWLGLAGLLIIFQIRPSSMKESFSWIWRRACSCGLQDSSPVARNHLRDLVRR